MELEGGSQYLDINGGETSPAEWACIGPLRNQNFSDWKQRKLIPWPIVEYTRYRTHDRTATWPIVLQPDLHNNRCEGAIGLWLRVRDGQG